MHIRIRQLGLSDIPTLQVIGRAAYTPYYSYLWENGGMEWYMNYCFNDERLSEDLNNPNIAYFLAETSEQQAIGFMKVVWQQAVPSKPNSKATLLEKIYLLPPFIGQKKGRFLVNWLSMKCKKAGQTWLWLDAMQSGPVKAYEQMGFSIVCEREIPFSQMKKKERHIWVMAKKL